MGTVKYWHGLEPYVVFKTAAWPWEGDVEKKIKVPEGMLQAARQATKGWDFCPEALEAALRWLSSNPIAPTQSQANDLANAYRGAEPYGCATQYAIAEWQRRMLLAPEPEVGLVVKRIIERFQGVTLTPREADTIIDEIALVTHGWVRPDLRTEKLEPAVSLDEEKERFRDALEKLAKLGNGDHYGNSDGNVIAQKALGVNQPDFGELWNACTVEINRIGGIRKATDILRLAMSDQDVPHVDDLMWRINNPQDPNDGRVCDDHNLNVLEAFRRGQKVQTERTTTK